MKEPNMTANGQQDDAAPQGMVLRPVKLNALQQTQEQIATCLAVTQALAPYLLPGQDGAKREDNLDENTLLSAQGTFIRATTRLDRILDDDTRWDVAQAENLETAMTEVAQAQRDSYRAMVEQSKAATRPCTLLSAKVTKIGDEFVVYYGDLRDTDTLIYGRGKTLAEAMDAFDQAVGDKPLPKPSIPEQPKPKRRIVPPEERTNRKPPTNEQK